MATVKKLILTTLLAIMCLCTNAQNPTKADNSLPPQLHNYTTTQLTPHKGKDVVKHNNNKTDKTATKTKKGNISIEELIPDFNAWLETIQFLSTDAIQEEKDKTEKHINDLNNTKDKDAYIREQQLNAYINSINDSLAQYHKNTTSLITTFIENYGKREINNKKECIDSIQAILTNRLKQRQDNISQLHNSLPPQLHNSTTPQPYEFLSHWEAIAAAALLTLIIILSIYLWRARAKRRSTTLADTSHNADPEAASAIVVRRKTTSILRKQSLEDVIDNQEYYKIDCNEFCNDSAVRRIYIKNTCIKDIYNMYAEDLRNPSNPKEDGCMVIGRWVYDTETKEYYISLEHIVLPGDDAVFAEYELNFGGKIKLKVTDKLRKLRRETNLQYDLTCWVHSHPGLGVFFSNSDNSVHMQLKHPAHPDMLIAIVVDILTPQQELGIFTFKQDATMNSKADIKKMYSLEKLYKWAVESQRSSFSRDHYFNALTNAKKRNEKFYAIQLSNSAIIDMAKYTAEENTGFVAKVFGYQYQHGIKTEYVVQTVSKNEAVPDNDFIAAFIMATHCSIPSIRKAIANYTDKVKFVLVYTSSDGMITAIPLSDNDICTDENYYGEQKIEELKIWTRRRR